MTVQPAEILRHEGHDGELPTPLLAAAVLATTGFRFLLMGSCALWLYGMKDLRPRDLDIVPDPRVPNLSVAARCLNEIGVPGVEVPSVRSLEVLDVVSLESAYGPCDLLLNRGREDFDRFEQRGTTMEVLGVHIAVAPEVDAVRLREQYKDAP